MDRCEILLKMLWTKSISMRQYKQMSRERGFAEILLLFLFVFIYCFANILYQFSILFCKIREYYAYLTMA